ncbi:tapasin-related protein isoform X2 [Lepisosteus oculatus]|uniref:tapasin-related protein isoform X2 n=1 Tax=Lepisosteus oculatus TaxID=7918 RepID=UPI0035F51FD9
MRLAFGVLVLASHLMSSVSGSVADVVLACSLVEEGGGMGGRLAGAGALFTRDEATLVLRDLPVTADESLDTVTPFAPPAPDPENLIFEATVTSLEIPEADSLLHADCNEQEVTCEISRYFPRGPEGTEPSPEDAFFIGSLQLEGGGVSLTLVLRTQPIPAEQEEDGGRPLRQSKLDLPLSPSGTILNEVVFVVFTRLQSLTAPLGGSALIDCGYKEATPSQEVALEWRLQHKGHGRRILQLRAGREGEEPTVHPEREGASVEPGLVLEEGNVSLTLTNVKVADEGTYICTVGSGVYQAQQVIQLHITQTPSVTLTPNQLVFQDDTPQRVICHCDHYYPLDVQVEWFSLSPSASEPVPISNGVYFSSHRQHSDGTYSLSAYISVSPSEDLTGATFSCIVSHHSLSEPITASITISAPEESQLWSMVGGVLSFVLFLFGLFMLLR